MSIGCSGEYSYVKVSDSILAVVNKTNPVTDCGEFNETSNVIDVAVVSNVPSPSDKIFCNPGMLTVACAPNIFSSRKGTFAGVIDSPQITTENLKKSRYSIQSGEIKTGIKL